jgi:hypothetical protein
MLSPANLTASVMIFRVDFSNAGSSSAGSGRGSLDKSQGAGPQEGVTATCMRVSGASRIHASCAAHWIAFLDEDDPSTPTTTPRFICWLDISCSLSFGPRNSVIPIFMTLVFALSAVRNIWSFDEWPSALGCLAIVSLRVRTRRCELPGRQREQSARSVRQRLGRRPTMAGLTSLSRRAVAAASPPDIAGLSEFRPRGGRACIA